MFLNLNTHCVSFFYLFRLFIFSQDPVNAGASTISNKTESTVWEVLQLAAAATTCASQLNINTMAWPMTVLFKICGCHLAKCYAYCCVLFMC